MGNDSNDSKDRIRRRASEIWESEGRSGDPQTHWFRAEQELGTSPKGEAAGQTEAHDRSPEAEKMAEQIQVALDARNARSKQTGRGGSTGRKKGAAKSARPRES